MVKTPKVSRGLRVLQSSATSKSSDVAAEKDALMKEIAQIEQWFRDPRWKETTRSYSGVFAFYLLYFSIIDARRYILTACVFRPPRL